MSSVMPVRPIISGVSRRSGSTKVWKVSTISPFLSTHRADLRDGLLRDLEAGRLNVEADDLIGKTDVLMPVNGDAVVNDC